MLVLAANGKDELATVALRPSGIFGEGDPLLVPTIVAKAKQGKMGVIIGSGQNLMDFTYVGNVAQAHLQVRPFTLPACFYICIAADLLSSGKAAASESCCRTSLLAAHRRQPQAIVYFPGQLSWALCRLKPRHALVSRL